MRAVATWPAASKVDVFVSRGRRFDVAVMDRAVALPLAAGGEATVPVATPEDSIVAKFEWFRLGEESSERQWQDVAQFVAPHGDTLDTASVRHMAESVGVADLLERLLRCIESA